MPVLVATGVTGSSPVMGACWRRSGSGLAIDPGEWWRAAGPIVKSARMSSANNGLTASTLPGWDAALLNTRVGRPGRWGGVRPGSGRVCRRVDWRVICAMPRPRRGSWGTRRCTELPAGRPGDAAWVTSGCSANIGWRAAMRVKTSAVGRQAGVISWAAPTACSLLVWTRPMASSTDPEVARRQHRRGPGKRSGKIRTPCLTPLEPTRWARSGTMNRADGAWPGALRWRRCLVRLYTGGTAATSWLATTF